MRAPSPKLPGATRNPRPANPTTSPKTMPTVGRGPLCQSHSSTTIHRGTDPTINALTPDGTCCSAQLTKPFPPSSKKPPTMAASRQWMTSGRGILHEEMPRRGANGEIYGFQLWVNLPAALKMSKPRYQEVNAKNIPSVEKNGVTVRVVAGDVFGVKGPVTEIAASPVYIDVTLAPGAEFLLPPGVVLADGRPRPDPESPERRLAHHQYLAGRIRRRHLYRGLRQRCANSTPSTSPGCVLSST